MVKDLWIIAFVFTGASVVPFLARRLRVPSASIEIIFGFLAFNLVLKQLPQWLSFFKELGLIYLMFLAGMELDLRQLNDRSRLCLYMGLCGAGFVIAPVVAIWAGLPFYAGIAGAVMSAGVAVPVLKEMKLIDGPFGRQALNLALSGEVLSIVVLTGLDIYHESGLSLLALWDLLRISVMLGLSALFLRGLYFFSWWYSDKVQSVMESEDPVEEGIRGIVAIVFAGAMVAYLSGIEPILGSFITGAIFSYVYRSKGVFHEKINGLGFGFFIPLFFIGIGAELRPHLFTSPEVLTSALVILLLPIVSHLPIVVFSRALGLSKIQSLATTLLVSAPLSMMVVAGALGLKLGFIRHDMKTAIVLAAIGGSLVYPFLFRVLSTKPLKP